ncbi:TRAP transporter large permease [Hoeflea sp. WL0058]|uniref:TRAP transporter large permease protein n=1 Tax=Flavimaribacter sediminis TaxID=2865987 RepID=A0AAE3D2C0_9HYPH|nr:TRAP transporter large permease [Flavimaribacter sediminis]MBW8638438.1 TRAP transporter large permease [Flavimaribacter sediminis]
MIAALLGLACLILLVLIGFPLAFVMAFVGLSGLTLLIGFEPAVGQLARATVDTMTDYTFSILPLFLLMAHFVARSGLAAELYAASYAIVGHWRGGLAMSTIIACGGFSTISGSSLATVATMAPIAMPEMQARGYRRELATGAIASGGTLGILIPPSIILVVYGNLTETDIGELFIAGIVPGLIGLAFYVGAVVAVTWFDPAAGPAGEKMAWRERLRALGRVWGLVLMFVTIIGGIYLGLFTPTEAAGAGAIIALIFALVRRSLTWPIVVDTFVKTAVTTAALLMLVASSQIFATFINISGLPRDLLDLIARTSMAPWMVIAIICAAFLVLGCALEAFSLVLLFVPIVYPIVASLGFDLIWFGILLVVVVEVGLISPPVGLNVFVLKSVVPGIPLATIYRGILPFIFADVTRLLLLCLAPWLVLFLPNAMH